MTVIILRATMEEIIVFQGTGLALCGSIDIAYLKVYMCATTQFLRVRLFLSHGIPFFVPFIININVFGFLRGCTHERLVREFIMGTVREASRMKGGI